MKQISDNMPEFDVDPIKEEVKRFITDEASYYAVTMSGALFNIMRYQVYTLKIDGTEDFFSIMLIECVGGYYLLRQKLTGGFALPWVLEVEIIPPEKDINFFYRFREYIDKDQEVLLDICGEPLEQEIPKSKKPNFIYPD